MADINWRCIFNISSVSQARSRFDFRSAKRTNGKGPALARSAFVSSSFCQRLYRRAVAPRSNSAARAAWLDATVVWHSRGVARRGSVWLDAAWHGSMLDAARRCTAPFIARAWTLGTAFGWRDAARIYHRARQERGYYASAHTYLPRSEETRRFCASERKREKSKAEKGDEEK